MPVLNLTDEEAQGLVSLLINAMVAANPLLKKIIEQAQSPAPGNPVSASPAPAGNKEDHPPP